MPDSDSSSTKDSFRLFSNLYSLKLLRHLQLLYRDHPAISHCSHLLQKCRVATNISHWLKVHLGGSKPTYLRKSVFLSAFGISNIAFIIPSHFIIVPYFTIWMLDFFNAIRVSNSLEPDQAQRFVWSDLGPNCLQRLSAVNT